MIRKIPNSRELVLAQRPNIHTSKEELQRIDYIKNKLRQPNTPISLTYMLAIIGLRKVIENNLYPPAIFNNDTTDTTDTTDTPHTPHTTDTTDTLHTF